MNSENLFYKQVAIVTGGSSGIGQATCFALAKIGFQVVVVGTKPEAINQTVSQLNELSASQPEITHLGLTLNVICEEDMQTMAAKTLDYFGRIDLLIASAGIGKKSGSQQLIPPSTASLSLDEWEEILNVNLTGVFLSNKAVLPVMVAQQSGHIINISSATSMHGLRGQAYAPAYCASKFGVVGFSESLAEEVCADGIRVQVFLPGLVTTPLVAKTALSRRFGGRAMSASSMAAAIVNLLQQPSNAIIAHPYVLPFGGVTA